MAGAFADLAQGQAVLPLRTPIFVPEHAGVSWPRPPSSRAQAPWD